MATKKKTAKKKRVAADKPRDVGTLNTRDQVGMLDTSTDFFLLFSPGLKVFNNGIDITSTLQATATSGRTLFVQSSTEERVVPREGVLSNQKKAVFMLRIAKDCKPLP